jgi:cytochrome P450
MIAQAMSTFLDFCSQYSREILVGGLCTALLYTWKKRLSVPGPFALPFIGNLPTLVSYGDKLHELFDSWFEKYGDIYVLYSKVPFVVITHPDEIKRMLTTDDYYRDDDFYNMNYDIIPDGLFLLPTGRRWAHHRKMLQVAFSPQQLRYGGLVALEETKMFMKCVDLAIDTQGILDASAIANAFTFEVLGKFGFRYNFGTLDEFLNEKKPKILQDMSDLVQVLQIRYFIPRFLWRLFNVHESDAIQRKCDAIRSKALDMKAIRLQEIADAGTAGDRLNYDKDVLQRLLMDNGEGIGFEETEIIGELLAFFFAGHETTGHTITAAILELTRHPAVIAKLREEIDPFMENYLANGGDFYGDVLKLKYLDSVLREIQRFHSIVPRLRRTTTNDIQVLGYRIPKNTAVVANLQGIHRHPRYWKNPNEFIPERWHDRKAQNSYMPFGDGPMNCIGQKLAVTEFKILISHLFYHYDFQLVDGFKYEMSTSITYGFKNGVPLTATRRK